MEREIAVSDLMHVYGGFGRNVDYTVRITARMADPVDPAALVRAVRLTDARYPYFSQKLTEEGGLLRYTDCGCETAVFGTDGRITLGSDEAGGHIWAVCSSEDRIHLDFYHGAADGTGMYSVLATLLYHYCEARYGLRDAGNIPAFGGKICAYETEDPYGSIPPYRELGVRGCDLSNTFCLTSDGGLAPSSPTVWDIQLPEEAFIRFTSAKDSTPGTMISLLTAKAIDKLYPERKKDIVSAYVINARPMLNVRNIAHNTLGMALFPFTGRIKALPFETQCTVYRGMTFLQSDEGTVRRAAAENAAALKAAFGSQSGYDAKKRAFGDMFGAGDGRITFLVSYTGKWKYPAVEPYMRELWSHPPNTFDLMIEINAAAGGIFLSIQQRFGGDCIREALLSELAANGIPFTVKGKLGSDNAFFPEPIKG